MLDQRDEPVDENAVRQPAPGSVARLWELEKASPVGPVDSGLDLHSVNMFGYLYLGDEDIYGASLGRAQVEQPILRPCPRCGFS